MHLPEPSPRFAQNGPACTFPLPPRGPTTHSPPERENPDHATVRTTSSRLRAPHPPDCQPPGAVNHGRARQATPWPRTSTATQEQRQANAQRYRSGSDQKAKHQRGGQYRSDAPADQPPALMNPLHLCHSIAALVVQTPSSTVATPLGTLAS